MKKTAKIMNLFMPVIVLVMAVFVALPVLGMYGHDSKMVSRIVMTFGIGWTVGSLVEYLTMRLAGGPGIKEWK